MASVGCRENSPAIESDGFSTVCTSIDLNMNVCVEAGVSLFLFFVREKAATNAVYPIWKEMKMCTESNQSPQKVAAYVVHAHAHAPRPFPSTSGRSKITLLHKHKGETAPVRAGRLDCPGPLLLEETRPFRGKAVLRYVAREGKHSPTLQSYSTL